MEGYCGSFFASLPTKSWKEITKADIEAYNYRAFVERPRSHSTQNQFINALKLFYRTNGSLHIVPDQLVRPRKETKLPNVLSKKEIGRILAASTNIKHHCLLAVVYGAGLRIGEALNLRIEDIRSEENLLYIRRSKGRKDRRVPLSATMLRLLRTYYMGYRPQEYVFEGQTGGRYSARSAQQVLKRACRRAGIKTAVTLHTLRHSYATHLLEQGVGLRYIQEILGHNSPKTTMIYTHISGKRLSEIRSPLDDMEI